MFLLALNIDRRGDVAAPALGEKGARDAFAHAVADFVFHGRDGEMHFVRMRGE